ncbi:homeodomain-interacting protein kinase 3-like [Gouania willdenowi]|uniref:homeodomain-interacting protein kinase 3-like n=1 Tax=Gouania willdenowi TaxID=441366 RepID=UPI0010552139|nr:homeodomain-interacting protein kinase 3-like [Gouania willdenowi]
MESAELQVLHSSTVDYSILECVGEGNFGKVVKCQNLSNNETVAVKLIKEGFEEDLQHEISILKLISVLDADRTNLLKFYEHFVYMDYNCLAFELLDVDLYTLMENREWESLSLTEIRSIAEQLLVALDFLKDLGIIHTDIKPDNVMVVSGKIQPLKVKLIDFGLAIRTSSMEPGLDIQPLGYRAPEVSIGLPFSEAIDVWGLGCLLTFLYIGENLLSVSCDYQMIKRVSELLGLPKDDQLQAGVHTRSFYCEAEEGSKWRLMTPEEYEAANNIVPEEQQRFVEFSSLDDLVNVHPGEESGESEDSKAFVDLLKQLLCLDGDERISPCQAQFHHFFTTSHLNQQETSRHYQPSSQADNTTCPASGCVCSGSSLCDRIKNGDRLNLAATSWDMVYVTLSEEELSLSSITCDALVAEALHDLPTVTDVDLEVQYLGHRISEEGVSTDPGKISAVSNWPHPKTVPELQSFIGFASYYRRFVEGFSKLAAPLHRLVAELSGHNNRRGRGTYLGDAWSEECEESFKELKSCLMPTTVDWELCYHRSKEEK